MDDDVNSVIDAKMVAETILLIRRLWCLREYGLSIHLNLTVDKLL